MSVFFLFFFAFRPSFLPAKVYVAVLFWIELHFYAEFVILLS